MTRLLTLMFALLLAGGCGRMFRHRVTSLPQEAYVWQRVWTHEVKRAVQGTAIESLHVLAAELRFEQESAVDTAIVPDWEVLKGYSGNKGAVIRIHASAAKTRWKPDAVNALKLLLEETWRRFDAEGVGLAEVQIDYDCPESRLADYVALMRELREEWPNPLKITALPAWLVHSEARELLALSPGYVLQVHSLHLPRNGGCYSLLNEAEARSAVARAVSMGIPFRVALPTYSCVVVFDEKGGVKDVHGEDLPTGFSLAEQNYAVLDADAYAMASLLDEWRKQGSELLQSVIWYRLPVATDRLNWPAETFERVVRGDSLKRGWEARLEPRTGGLHEVVLHQRGDAPDELPKDIEITHVEAADGLRGYAVQAQAPGKIHLRLADPGRFGRIRPGERIVAGWAKTSARAEVKILHQEAVK